MTRKRPTRFKAPTSERKRFVIWVWTNGPYVKAGWYPRMKLDTLEMARSRIAYLQEHHPEEMEYGHILTVETTVVTHEVIEGSQ